MSENRTPGQRHVTTGLYWKTAFFARTRPVWRALGRLESAVLEDLIAEHPIERPIFVAGVPRSGTTILTEILARHPAVTSHRYSDFPNVYTPYWRNWLADRLRPGKSEPVERAHKDRIMITHLSPEAVEEVVWMDFFDHLHDSARNQVLTAATSNPDFERVYREHVSKLLAVRGATRYLAKGNYNINRLGYIARLFPDARFIVPWREPVAQVASLVKQDRLFTRMAEEDPRVPTQLERSGHFEFGPSRRAVNVGSRARAEAIERDWAAGALATGWARYWADVYANLLDAIEDDRRLRDAVLLVDYQQLCGRPEATLLAVRDHCRLAPDTFDPIAAEYALRLSLPDYYAPEFESGALESITTITESTLGRLRSAPAFRPSDLPDRR
ncbi:MAG TPA: sulfotransferase [Wenzhouxiangellaceae bacterium]|nr:sulfotransferase [Wenzhouxiangellaceae bacterium]